MRLCEIPGCTRKHVAKGYCDMHYKRMLRGGKIQVKVIVPVKNLNGEKWALIKNHETYSISTHGRVKNTITNKLLKLTKDRGKHVRVKLGTSTTIYVSNEMAKRFLKNHYNDRKIIFKDGNRDNLLISNIEWFTVYRRAKFLDMLNKPFKSKEESAVLEFINGNSSKLNNMIDENYSDFKKVVYNHIKRFDDKPNTSIIDDCVQIGLLKALKALKNGALKDLSNLNGWIATIIRNSTVNFLKENNRYKSENQVNKYGKEFNSIDLR